ncbi:hypothetical protein [Chitinimonas sp.]|uniref:hypothetical protein n=1 Tax=Chitinimonas sp. TaxID=1934313 RepID=UPI002F943CCF
MKTIAKLIAATVVGLTATYATAAETTYTDTVRHSSVAFYGAEQVGNVSPDNTDAYRRTAAKPRSGEYILVAGKAKHISPDNTDAFRRAGYVPEQGRSNNLIKLAAVELR